MTDTDTDANNDVRTDGSGTGIVAPDDEVPSWSERKERTTGLSRLTYEYFERARREDQDLRQESSYVERDVLGFPAWPHETIRNIALASFFVGMLLFLAALLPPTIEDPANPSETPSVILPDWYLYWSFGLLHLESLNPELALAGGEKIMSDQLYGVLANGVVFGAIAILPFLNKGSARRPVEEPFWASIGVGGVIFAFTLSLLPIEAMFPWDVHITFDMAFFLPVIGAIITYAVLKTMREGYMYNLNKRYYRLRPPR
ncbi:hypothetical protein [Natronosalvus halobius]|uniref:hypothetical protein n=1 Tax=Natronosalvus halobius TaxID=2953746 RepID=UPI0020A1F1F1|nr:hypothetical protein [Natronosalvus halobius]USZ70211.1 hypothetical protein NGM15_08725 [Natronosalvus halobius]